MCLPYTLGRLLEALKVQSLGQPTRVFPKTGLSSQGCISTDCRRSACVRWAPVIAGNPASQVRVYFVSDSSARRFPNLQGCYVVNRRDLYRPHSGAKP
jgi:hypothetical protein